MAGYFHLASADIKCRLKQTPQIKVVVTDTSVKYDHTKTQSQLDNFKIDTVSPYGRNTRTHVGGLMDGEVSVTQKTSMAQETYPALNTGCLYVHSIEVKIHIDPTIYIARDYKKAGCMYHAVMEHERKHVTVDRDIVNKYTGVIMAGLKNILEKRGYAYGPFNIEKMASSQQSIQDIIHSRLKQYAAQMTAERQERQQAVDSLAEYERVSAMCERES